MLRNSPRTVLLLLLAVSFAGLVLMTGMSYRFGNLPLVDLPVEYWIYTTLSLVFLFVCVVSLGMLRRPARSPSATMLAAGLLMGGISIWLFLCRITGEGWTGNTTMLVVAAAMGLATALILRLRQQH
jgi:hypothetical protein